ncbi:MAG: LLM class flavin-dependent oxidoreductase [Deltaproteobacteria bacterium]|nr:LLM class flavin-dependent oxidoreductase [Deltaproteobacteria bacterium]
MEFVLFLPQMRLSFDDLVARARAAEAAGFTGITGMDHLAPPMAEDKPMYEAMIANTWLAANTETLKIGSLVLCDSFRHPAVLARQAVSIDHASGGRFELGIGWGSLPSELTTFGVGSAEPADRVARLRETLEVLQALWSGEVVEYQGAFHELQGVQQVPGPLDRIPIVIGGVGRKTLALVRDFADWWNLEVRFIDRVDELRSQVGSARISIQKSVAFVGAGQDRDEIEQLARRRFRGTRPLVGSSAELVDYFGGLADSGVERVYTWFTDFARPETLEEFGETVIGELD